MLQTHHLRFGYFPLDGATQPHNIETCNFVFTGFYNMLEIQHLKFDYSPLDDTTKPHNIKFCYYRMGFFFVFCFYLYAK